MCRIRGRGGCERVGGTVWNTLKGGGIEKRRGAKILKRRACWSRGECLKKERLAWNSLTNYENGPSKICGRQPLKNLKRYGLLSRAFCSKFFKGCLPPIPLAPFSNTLFHLNSLNIWREIWQRLFTSLIQLPSVFYWGKGSFIYLTGSLSSSSSVTSYSLSSSSANSSDSSCIVSFCLQKEITAWIVLESDVLQMLGHAMEKGQCHVRAEVETWWMKWREEKKW